MGSMIVTEPKIGVFQHDPLTPNLATDLGPCAPRLQRGPIRRRVPSFVLDRRDFGSPSRTRTCDHWINSRTGRSGLLEERQSGDEQQIKAVASPRNQPQTPHAGVVQTGSVLSGPTDGRGPPVEPPLSSLNVIHQRQFVAGGEGAHVGQGAAVEDARNRLASRDHDDPDRAGLEVRAIVARSVRRDRSAGDRS